MTRPPAATAAVAAFIDAVNRGDLDGLAALMSDDHPMVVPDDEAIRGRSASVEAWRRYFESFPDYLIFRRHMTVDGNRVAVLGTTTGSHFGLPPEEEMKLSVIWLAEVSDGSLSQWQLAENTLELRTDLGMPTSA